MVSSTAVLQVLFLACVAASSPSPGAETDGKRPEPVLVAAATAAAVTADDDSGQRVTAATPPATQPKDVSILKQINKVNDDGSYTFGYEASDGSFKVETRDVAGNVKGMFGFVDDAGRLKRVSYSASNSSGFQAAGSESPRPSADPTAASAVQTIAGRRNKKDDGGDESDGGKSAATAVKKVLVSKRPVTVATTPDSRTKTEMEEDVDDHRRRGGNDLRRHLPRNDDGDAPDVYGVHGRSSLQESGPVSPVVSALMSELMPVRSYGRPTGPPPQPSPPPSGRDDAVSSRRAAQELQEEEYEDGGPQYGGGPTTVQYRGVRPSAALYQQRASYPTAAAAAYQQQQPVAYLAPLPQRGPSLVALRDELMELILSFVQARVSQLVSVAPYPAPAPYPMPYQQPNYYVPSYYQGPRMPGPTTEQAQESSPIVTQTLKDGLIRMLLSTSPRYDPDRIGERSTTRLAYRSTTTPHPTPVRSVQIISGGGGDDNENRVVDSRPVTTETPD